MKLVSIILTTHNGLNTLKRCLESALQQDYEKIEVIVVDDNGIGTVNQIATREIVEHFADDRIKYIAHKININGSAARNTGIKNSTGEFIAFLDDDDVLPINSISIRLKQLIQNDAGVSLGSFVQYIDNENPVYFKVDYSGNPTSDLLSLKCSTPSSIIMIKRSVIEKIGYWDEEFRRHQDWEFLIRASRYFKFCSTKEVVCKRYVTWRNNPKSPKNFKNARVFFLEKMKSIILSLDKNDISQIYLIHYYDIGKQYLKSGRIVSAYFWFFKTKKPIWCTKNVLRRARLSGK